MAGTKVVGKVAIKVWPDTRLFRKTLQKDVKEATERVDGDVEISPKVSETALRASLLEAIRKINLTAKTNPAYRFRIFADVEVTRLKEKVTKAIAGLGTQTIKIDTKVSDTDRVKEEINRDLSKVSGITIPGKIRPAVDITALNREVGKARLEAGLLLKRRGLNFIVGFEVRNNELLRQFETDMAWLKAKAKSVAIAIRTKLDKPEVEATLKLLKAKLELFAVKIKPKLDNVATRLVKAELAKVFDKTKVAVKATLSKEGVAAVKAKLAAAFRSTKVAVKAVLDNKSMAKVGTALSALSGARMVGELFDYKQLANLDKMAPKIALMGTSIGQMAAMAINAAGNMLSLGRSVAEIAPAALALPGIFAGFLTTAIAAGVALKDINNQIPALKGSMSRLADTIRSAFWDNAQKPMASLVKTWMPMFNSGMRKVGASTGTVFGSISSQLQKVVSSKLPGWFQATATAADNFASGAPGIAAITKNLGNLGATYMPRLAQFMADVANKWGAWLNEKNATGELFGMVERGVTRLKELGSVIGGVFGILDGLSKAASDAGGSTLKSLADGLNGVAAAIAKPEFQTQLVGVFKGAAGAMENLKQQAGPGVLKFFQTLANLLPTLLPLIGSVAGQFLNMVGSALSVPELSAGLTNFFTGLQSALTTIAPAFDSVGQGIGGLATLLGRFVQSVAPLVNIALGALQQHATGLIGALGGVVESLAGGLTSVVSAMIPGIRQLADAIIPLVSQLGGALGNILRDAAPGFGAAMTGIASAVTSLMGAIGPLVDLIGGSLGKVLGGLLSVLGGVVSMLAAIIGPIWKFQIAIMGWIIQPLADVAAKWGPKFGDSFTKIGQAIGKIMAPLTLLANILGPVLQPLFGWLFDFLAGAFGNALDFITKAFSDFADNVQRGADIIAQFWPPATKAAADSTAASAASMEESLKGIGGAADGTTGSINSMASAATDRLGQLSQQADLLTGNAKANVIANMTSMREQTLNQMAALATGSDAKIVAMAQNANSKMATLADSIPSLTGKAKDKALAKLDDMKASYESKFGNISSIVATGVSAVPAAVTANSAGISSAMVAPVKTGVDDVKAEVATLKGAITSTVTDMKGALKSSGQSIMQAIADGIRDRTGAAISAASDAMDAIRRVFPNSPAKEGAFSGKGWTLYSGRAIAQSVGDGIRDELGSARRASEELMTATRAPLEGASAARLSGSVVAASDLATSSEAPLTIGNITIGPDDPEYAEWLKFTQMLRRKKRQAGG